jgi:hypothetical protein
MDIKSKIEQLMLKSKENIDEIEEVVGEDFNPMDASGGNFDDAYDMGHQHGYQYGRLSVLNQLYSEFF